MRFLNNFMRHRKHPSSSFLFPLVSFRRRPESRVVTKPFERFDGWIPACAGMTVMGVLMTTFLILLFLFITPVQANSHKDTIKIGEMMSYTGAPRYAYPFKEGWQLAVEEVNAKGGIKGKQVEVISRDDQAEPGTAVRLAEELIERDEVVMLVGAGLDHVGLAVSDVANRRKIPFLKMWGGKCENIENPANQYWFVNMECIDYHGYIYAVEAAKKPYTRWATIAPNYEYGRNVTEAFKKALKKLRPDVEFVAERYPTLNKIKAQEEIRALAQTNPEAIFNQLFGGDMTQYLRVIQKLGIEDAYYYIGNYLGTPITMRELGSAYPKGWFTVGIPGNVSPYPMTEAFYQKYQERYGKNPDLTAIEGYRMMLFALAALDKAETFEPDSIVAAMNDLDIDTPTGHHRLRSEDKQMHTGYWVGYTDRVDGKNIFIDQGWFDLTNVAQEYKK
jgi:branched-chain amino acid transport system substrate-binding protein